MPAPSHLDKVFAHIAMKHRLVSAAQVRDAVDALTSGDANGATLGEVLAEQGALSRTSVRRLERAVGFRELRLDSKLYGRIAVKSKLSTVEQVNECLSLQLKAYQKREQPIELGVMLMERGLSPDADQAIRLAMAKVERDAYVAREEIRSLSELDAIQDDDGAPVAGKGRPGAKGRPAAKAKAKFGRRPLKAPPPRARPAARRAGEASGSEPEDDADGSGSEATTAKPARRGLFGRFGRKADGAPAKPKGGGLGARGRFGRKAAKPASASEDEADLGDGDDDAADDADDARADGSASGDEPGEEASASQVSASGEGSVPDLDAAPVSRSDSASGRHRLEETSDTIEPIVGPDDLSLGSAREASNRSDSDASDGGSDDEADDLGDEADDLAPLDVLAGEAARDADALSEDIEELDDLDDLDDLSDLPGPTAPAAPSDTTKIAVEGGPLECPKCNVSLEAGTTQCLYCGYTLGQGPGPGDTGPQAPLLEEDAHTEDIIAFENAGSDGSGGSSGSLDDMILSSGSQSAPEARAARGSGRGAARGGSGRGRAPAAASASEPPADEPPPAAAAEVRKATFAEAFKGVEALEEHSRMRLVRATERKGGARRLVVRLAAGIAPQDEQVREYLEDAAKVDALALRQVPALLWLGRDAEGLYAVYEDAPGLAPATARAAREVFNRKATACLVKQAAATLERIHEVEVICRELRPEMVLVPDGDGQEPVAIVAPGLMRLCDPPAEGLPDLQSDMLVPPERRRKAGRADARSDIFGLGALLCVLVTGEGLSGREPKELPDVPGPMASFLKKTLATATGMRYLDVKKAYFDLDRCPGAKGYEVAFER